MTDVAYYKNMEPLFGFWRIVRLIGEGSYGKVFEIEREDFGRKYTAAMKVISIPQNESELRSAMADGMTSESVHTYYRGIVNEIVDEFSLMAELKGVSNIVSYEDHQVIERTDRFGWDVLIRMELLTPVSDHIARCGMTRRDIAQLGIDICKALELCKKQNIIHRDIKPENIFVSKNGDYKLGDFGIAKTVEKTTGALSQKGTPFYMAPEIFRGEAYGASVDLYSLGLVLFRLLNNNRAPFLPLYPAPMLPSDRENALQRRLGGEELPCPVNADEEMLAVIRRASAFAPADRYASPAEMRADLERILERQDDTQTVCVGEVFSARVVTCEESTAAGPVEKTELGKKSDEQKKQRKEKEKKQRQKQLKGKKLLPILLAVAAVIALVAAGIVLFGSGNNADSNGENGAEDSSVDSTVDSTESGEMTFASMLWGSYVIDDYKVDDSGTYQRDTSNFMKGMQYEDIGDYNVSCVPYAISDCSWGTDYRFTKDDWEDQYEEFCAQYDEKYWENYKKTLELDVIEVSFVDKTGRTIYGGGPYRVEGNKLLVCYDWEMDDETFELTCGEWTEYTFRFEGRNLILERNGCCVEMVPAEFSTVWTATVSHFMGEGYAVSEKDMYQSIAGIDWFIYDNGDKHIYLDFADGGRAVDVTLDFGEDGILRISWQKINRLYNGRYHDFEEPGSIAVQYIYCDVWGFILIDDGQYYRYQNSREQYEEMMGIE